MASSATSLEEMIRILGDAALNDVEKAQVEILEKQVSDQAALVEKARKDPKSLTVREKAELAGVSNALGRIRQIRTGAFNRLFGIES